MKKIIWLLMLVVLCSFASAGTQEDLDAKLIGLWHFTTGANDSGPRGNNLTVDGASHNVAGGSFGGFYSMDGGDKLWRDTDTDFELDELCVNFYATFDVINAYQRLVTYTFDDADSWGWYTTADNSNRFQAYIYEGNGVNRDNFVSTAGDVASGYGWTMFTMSYDGTNWNYWINGTNQSITLSNTAASVGFKGTEKFGIGDFYWTGAWEGANRLQGDIDEVSVFNGTCTPSQVAFLNWSYYEYNATSVNLSISLDYPINTTTYYGSYIGEINVTLANVNGIEASCDINDSRWTLITPTPLGNGTVSFGNNTPIQQSNVSIFINCTDISGSRANLTFWFYQDNVLDLYFYDEETNTLLNGTLVYIDLISSGFASNYSTNTSFLNISSLVVGEYTINYFADGYDVRNHYITILEGRKNSANLYLLNSSESTLIIPTVYDQNSDLASNITIKIQRYYVATNSYITISMTKTNEEGEGVLYAELYDINYKIIFEYQEEIVLITDPYPFTSDTPVYRVNLVENAFESWVNYDNVITNVSFINDTGTIYARFIYNDVTNNLREGCLKVTRYTTTDTERICYNCTSSSAATLTCPIDHTIVGEYIAMGSFDTNTENSWYDAKLAALSIVAGKYALGQEGIFVSMIMIGTITLLGISTITGSFILLIVSFIFIAIIGLIQGVTLGTAMYLVVLAFVLLFIIRKVMEQ